MEIRHFDDETWNYIKYKNLSFPRVIREKLEHKEMLCKRVLFECFWSFWKDAGCFDLLGLLGIYRGASYIDGF